MNIIWSKGRVTVREVHEDMLRKEIESKEHGFIPYTTVMSTMTTLAEKGLLEQDKTSKTYLYSAAVDRKELSKRIIKSVAEKLLDEDTAKKVSKFLSEAL
jgi:predicted transcriptional regulator